MSSKGISQTRNQTTREQDKQIQTPQITETESTSHQRIGQPVVHLPDFDGTIYQGDVGQLAADHEQSQQLGFDDIDDFLGKVDKRRQHREDVSRGSEKANIIEEKSGSNIEDVEKILTESQDPGLIKDGFKQVAPHLYERGNMVEIATAGVDLAAKNLVNGSKAAVTGAQLKQNGEKIEVEKYCGRKEKPGRIKESLQEKGVEDFTPIAVGDSPTDGDYMEESAQVGGQAIAIEEGATDYATVDATEDTNYETVSVLHLIFDELYTTGSQEQARLRAENFLQDKDYQLEDVEAAENWNSVTLEALGVYEEVRECYN